LLKNDKLNESEKVIPDKNILFFQRNFTFNFEDVLNFLCKENNDRLKEIKQKFNFMKKNEHVKNLVAEFRKVEKIES
jgi:hypothetical protein